MKRFLRIGGGCLVTAALLVAALAGLTKVLERKASYAKYAPFFAQEEDFDVLFMGSSHLLNSVFPMELWKDYGIVSYNFGGHGNQLATTYWVMENALDYTTPKLMVIDCFYLEYEMKTSMNFAQVHLSFDAFPLSRTKIRAAFDLLEDDAFHESWTLDMAQRTRLNLLWDFAVYHDRWADLTEDDVDPAVTVEKGAESRIAISTPNAPATVPYGSKLEGETVGVRYLRRMIEDCQARGIHVLLTYLPFPSTGVDLKNAARVQDIAKEYGVGYIDFLSLPLLDDATDHYDPDSHLNPSGARKVTDYLGQYIKAHYDIPDRRQDEAYKAWEEDYRAYRDFQVSALKEQETLELYLMLLKSAHYDVEIQIMDPQVWERPLFTELMENLGAEQEGGLYVVRGKGAGETDTGETDTGEVTAGSGGQGTDADAPATEGEGTEDRTPDTEGQGMTADTPYAEGQGTVSDTPYAEGQGLVSDTPYAEGQGTVSDMPDAEGQGSGSADEGEICITVWDSETGERLDGAVFSPSGRVGQEAEAGS